MKEVLNLRSGLTTPEIVFNNSVAKNKKLLKGRRLIDGIFLLFFLTLFTACKKEVKTELPGDKESMELNFYPASDVFSTYISPASFTNIYIDHIAGNTSFPTFFYSINGTQYGYPVSTITNVIVYSSYNAGGHRIMFADTTNTVVLDTAINQPAKSYSCLYFTDAPAAVNAPAKYKMVAVQEDRSGVAPNQVGVRFIHLSADAGTLFCSRLKVDGTYTNALPSGLQFGEASPYQYFTAADTTAGTLRFTIKNPVNGASVVTAVTYSPGNKYAIIINGFYNDQQRQIITGKNPDGSKRYQSINIQRNLRATLRRIY